MSDPEHETTSGWLGGVLCIALFLVALFVLGAMVRAL